MDTVISNHGQGKQIALLFGYKVRLKGYIFIFLFLGFVALSGCKNVLYMHKEDTNQSNQFINHMESVWPELPPPDAPPAYLEYAHIVPQQGSDDQPSNDMVTPILTKRKAKEKVRKGLENSIKSINKCFKYEQQINQTIGEEQWWRTFSQGGFIKKWVANNMLLNKRKRKTRKVGLLQAELEIAHQYLHEAEQYIILAEGLGSTKQSKDFRRKTRALDNQICTIRQAMDGYIGR